jgi:UDPglucose 6-dehydrogenase
MKESKMSYDLVAYVGLTHLGLVSAGAALEKGFNILCFDPDEELVKKLKNNQYPINEPGFAESIVKNKDRIFFTSCLDDLKKADIIYIAPDIPTTDKGISNLEGIRKLIDLISPYISRTSCLIVLSQVPPGFTRSLQKTTLSTQLDPGKIYYQVETLVFGIALHRALYPERFIIGTQDTKTPLDLKFESFLKAFNCPLLIMDYESAEFCKICINAFLASTVSTANTLEEICQKIGAKWSDIVPALRLDKRIGEYAYLMPGLGLSGGNIERDLRTITSLSQEKGAHGKVVDAFIKNSHHRRNWPLNIFYRHILPKFLDKDITIGILGLSYKENTHSTKNSAALQLISKLQGFNIQVYDPLVKTLPLASYAISIKTTAMEAVKGADVLFLMTPWPEFKSQNPEELLLLMRKKFIVDPYRLIEVNSDVAIANKLTYYSLC